MVRLLLRADDLGYCEAVNYGIAKCVEDGMIRSVGLMPNMPSAAHGLRLLDGSGVCMGQHTNICLGKPCTEPEKIPSLVNGNGEFKSSREYREAYARGQDFVCLDDAVLEIEAQYHRFVELTGSQPDYFEAHAVMSENLYRGLEIVAERYHLKYNRISPMERTGTFEGKEIAACSVKSMEPDYDPFVCLKEAVRDADQTLPNVYVCHPGYLDAYLLRTSSLTVNRTKEVEMLCDSEMKQWLKKQDVRLITYREI